MFNKRIGLQRDFYDYENIKFRQKQYYKGDVNTS